MGDWGTLLVTMVFASILVATAVMISERFAGVWAPVWIMGFLVGMSILFDYGGARQTEFFLLGRPMLFACGPMLWPVLALGQDYLNEFYGKRIAYNYTISMFLAKIGVALGTLWIIQVLPAPRDPALNETAILFNRIMLNAPRINIASIVAVVVAFVVNAWVYDLLRTTTKGRHLWLRNVVSSATALTVDAFVFFYGAFVGVLPLAVVWGITTAYLLVCYSTVFIDMFFLYVMVQVKAKGVFGVRDRVGESLRIETLKAYQARIAE